MGSESSSLESAQLTHWREVLYNQAWREYEHENTLSQQRNTIFLGVNTALIGFCFTILSQLFHKDENLHLLWTAVAGTMIFFGLLSIPMLRYWRRVTDGGMGFLRARWCIILRIEQELGLHQVGLASLEDRWRRTCRKIGTNEYLPFEKEPTSALCQLRIPAHEPLDGWESTRRMIRMFSVFWHIFMALGLAITYVKWEMIRPLAFPKLNPGEVISLVAIVALVLHFPEQHRLRSWRIHQERIRREIRRTVRDACCWS